MKGLITKELIMLKKQWISLTLMIIAFSASAIFGEISFALILPVIMSIFPINLTAMDEQSKWQQYAIALPYGRKTIVSSKYVFYIINTLISMVILTVVYIISCIVNKETGISLMSLLFSGLVMGNIYPLIMLPLVFKFNSTTGRTILMIISCIFGGLIGGTTSMLLASDDIINDIIGNEAIINIFTSPLIPVVIIAVVIVLYLISWQISVRIYEKRDL